jgi:acyl carrier protein
VLSRVRSIPQGSNGSAEDLQVVASEVIRSGRSVDREAFGIETAKKISGGLGMDVAAKVKEIIVQQLGVDADKVTPEASFVDDLGADSLDVVELVMAFEEEFGVEIPDEAAENIATVKDAFEFLKKNMDA